MLVSRANASDVETRLTAVFIGRFASYVEWPPADRRHFVITVLGANPFGRLLEELYSGKSIHGKPVELHYITSLERIGQTDILFINLQGVAARQAAIEFSRKHGILSISDSRGFADSGGIIQLNFVEQKTQIKINHTAALESRLMIGSPLLSIATVLRREQP